MTEETKLQPMREVRIAKITLNIGAGKNQDLLKRGIKLLEKLTPVKPVRTTAKKRIPTWGLRPGLPIACKVTIRKNPEVLLKRLLVAKDNILLKKCFDRSGNFSFGVAEYIDIDGLEYDPDLKILGLEAAVSLERPGYRIKKRKIAPKKLGKDHVISKEDAMKFMQDKFGVKIE